MEGVGSDRFNTNSGFNNYGTFYLYNNNNNNNNNNM